MEVSLDSFSLAGKVAVVTGAGGGIGRGISLGFARVGADVALAGHRPANLDITAAEIRQTGRDPEMILADVTKESDVRRLIDRTLERFGRIDVIANVVGGLPMKDRGLLTAVSDENLDSVINLNLRSAFLCSQAAAKAMIEHRIRGSIINLGSVSGITRNPRGGLYGAAKAAVIHLTKTLAHELGEHGIRVNAIAPGVIDTALNREARAYLKVDDMKLTELIPLRRLGRAEDVAGVAVFLASEASAYVTGQTIVVGGGLEFWG